MYSLGHIVASQSVLTKVMRTSFREPKRNLGGWSDMCLPPTHTLLTPYPRSAGRTQIHMFQSEEYAVELSFQFDLDHVSSGIHTL